MNSIGVLKDIGKVHHYKADEHIFLQGEKGDSLYLLLKGLVEVYLVSDFDGTHIKLSELEEGSIFGEMAILQNNFRSASIQAIKDTTVLKIDKEGFEEFISLEPKHAINLMKILSRRYIDTFNRVRETEVDYGL